MHVHAMYMQRGTSRTTFAGKAPCMYMQCICNEERAEQLSRLSTSCGTRKHPQRRDRCSATIVSTPASHNTRRYRGVPAADGVTGGTIIIPWPVPGVGSGPHEHHVLVVLLSGDERHSSSGRERPATIRPIFITIVTPVRSGAPVR